MRIVFMGGPWDGRAHEVARPDLPYRVVVPIEWDGIGVRYEETTYEPRRLIINRRIAKRSDDPGWRWVMVPLGSTPAHCDDLLAQHSSPIVNGARHRAAA